MGEGPGRQEGHVGAGSVFLARMGAARVDGIALVCIAAFATLYMSGIVLNGFIYPRVALYFGAAREIATLAGGLTYLCALLIARVKPECLFVKRISVVFVVLSIAMAPMLAYALQSSDPFVTVVALCIRSVVRAWAMTLLVASLIRVRKLKSVTLIVVIGLVLGGAVHLVMPLFGAIGAATAFLSLVTVLPVALLTGLAQPVLGRVRTGAPADVVELLHPSAFLKPSHGLFVCVLLFSIAAGYAMCLGEIENAPAGKSSFAFVLLAVVVYAFVVKGDHQEDLLFSFSVVLVMAGFLMVPVTLGNDSTVANLLIDLGENCFEILLWLMFASIGRRNLFAMLPTFGFAEFCSSVGTDIGAMAGHASNALVHGDERMVVSFALLFSFVFFAFLWLGFRRFSFTEVVFGVEPVSAWAFPGVGSASDSPLLSSRGEAGRSKDGAAPSFAVDDAEDAGEGAEGMRQGGDPAEAMVRRCAELAGSFGLTEREGEIFAMLARGRNARFIMEEFVLSRNTVKSHIKHIYGKLGVHSQQELIDMVEGK